MRKTSYLLSGAAILALPVLFSTAVLAQSDYSSGTSANTSDGTDSSGAAASSSPSQQSTSGKQMHSSQKKSGVSNESLNNSTDTAGGYRAKPRDRAIDRGAGSDSSGASTTPQAGDRSTSQ